MTAAGTELGTPLAAQKTPPSGLLELQVRAAKTVLVAIYAATLCIAWEELQAASWLP